MKGILRAVCVPLEFRGAGSFDFQKSKWSEP